MDDMTDPAPFEPLGAQLDEARAALNALCAAKPLWHPGSVADEQIRGGGEFAGLPIKSPLPHMFVTPMNSLGQARDLLVAYIAIIRVPDTVLALMPILRTFLVALAHTFYLVDPAIDLRERVRRILNVEFDSITEMMNFYQRGNEGFDHYDARRRKLASGAISVAYRAVRPETKLGKTVFIPWYLPPTPPTEMEMEMLRQLMGFLADASIPDEVYRLLSASTHAQPHALLPMIFRDQAVSDDAGYSTVPIGIDGRAMIMWALTIVGCLDAVIRRCVGLYGWDPLRWNSVVPRLMRDWVAIVRQ